MRCVDRAAIAGRDKVPELLIPRCMATEDESAPVRREIQFQKAITTDGYVIDCNQFFNGSQGLINAIEPAIVGLQGSVTYYRAEVGTSGISTIICDSPETCQQVLSMSCMYTHVDQFSIGASPLSVPTHRTKQSISFETGTN